MHAECNIECSAEHRDESSSSEERQGRAIALVGVVITLLTLLVLAHGLLFNG